MKVNKLGLIFLATMLGISYQQTDLLTAFFNKYILTTNTDAAKIQGTLQASYAGYDTALYLGDSLTGLYRPTINTDFGILFEGNQYAVINPASSSSSFYLNQLASSGSSLMMWVYIMDGKRDQVLTCKLSRDSAFDVTEKLCIGMKDGYFWASVLSETLKFDVEVDEGWNLVAFNIQQYSASTKSKIRIIAYSRTRQQAGTRQFTYLYQDDPSYYLVFGGKFVDDGIRVPKAFAGYMLEIRFFPTKVVTIEELDSQVNFDCISAGGYNTAKYCEACPYFITSNSGKCLEDLRMAQRNTKNYLAASYIFSPSTKQGNGRFFYGNQVTGQPSYTLYHGRGFPEGRTEPFEPHISEESGVYFDGNDYLSQSSAGSAFALNKHFTIEMWCRFVESNVTQNYYLFQKLNTIGIDKVKFQFYINTRRELVVELNGTTALTVYDAYNNKTFPQAWVYIGVSVANVRYDSYNKEYESKICAYIWGPDNFERFGCSVISDYFAERDTKPYVWDTRVGSGLIGFVKTFYIFNFYKAMTNLYYTPKRNTPQKDQCVPYGNMLTPTCSACDQELGAYKCFTACNSNTFANDYSQCTTTKCTDSLCITCVKDSFAQFDNQCTTCIEHASIPGGSFGNIGKCRCDEGYYLDEINKICKPCNYMCSKCWGPGVDQCSACKAPYPNYDGRCVADCSKIDYPFNTTSVYDPQSNQCKKCYDFYYTTDWKTCVAQAHPLKVTNYNNQYLIVDFTQPVKYSGTKAKNLFNIVISGNKKSYAFEFDVPFWEPDTYQKNVFIQLNVKQATTGKEQILVYVDNLYISDYRDQKLITKNSTSKVDYLPLVANVTAADYTDQYAGLIAAAGNSLFFGMLATLAFNAAIAILSAGSMELMWAFLNVVQIMNYIPLLQLNYTSNMVKLFSYLSIANQNIELFATTFRFVFDLDSESFPNDSYINSNFNDSGFSSMKLMMNLGSQFAIISIFIIIMPWIVAIKNILVRYYNRGHALARFEESLYWNTYIRFYLEGFLELNCAAFINLLSLEFITPMNVFCSLLTLFMICLAIFFPVASCFYIYFNKHKLRTDHQSLERFGAIYEEYKDDRWYRSMFNLFFVIRRLLFIFLLVFINNDPLKQLIMFQILNLLMILCFIIMKPYRKEIVNTMSIINEVILFIIGCYLFVFLSNDDDQDETIIFYSWIVIGLVCLMVLANLLFIIPYQIYQLYRDCLENQRIKRLRFIAEVEQKYLYFDYKRFFLSTFRYYGWSRRPKLQVVEDDGVTLKPTEINYPVEVVEKDPFGDRAEPEAYSTYQALDVKKDAPIYANPMDEIGERFESENDDLFNDRVRPGAYANDAIRKSQGRFPWLTGGPLNVSNNFGGPMDDDQQSIMNSSIGGDRPGSFFQNFPFIPGGPGTYPGPLNQAGSTDPNWKEGRNSKKNVQFADSPKQQMNNTDGFAQDRRKPEPIIDGLMIPNDGASPRRLNNGEEPFGAPALAFSQNFKRPSPRNNPLWE